MLRTVLVITVLPVLFSGTMLSAHETFRIIGTIVKFENWRLDVKTTDGEMFQLQLQDYTPIERNKKPATAKELKAGRGVVVEVVADTPYDADRYIARVTVVPPIAPRRTK